MKNLLCVVQPEFVDALKIFRKGGQKKGFALLCYEGGFLSIESGDKTAVMRAEGEWHGRATFRHQILQALAVVPPATKSITISYADNHLLIGGMTIPCTWALEGKSFIDDLVNPSLLDLLVLEKFVPRSELHVTERGKRIVSAVNTLEKQIAIASKALGDFGVTEEELRELTNRKISDRTMELKG